MFNKENLNISIITNFGCQTNCWYCIWENHPLKDIQLNIDWNLMDKFFDTFKKDKVSISGGGDCLYNYETYKDTFWDILFAKCKERNIKVDVHSREKFYNDAFWRNVNRCVLSSDIFEEDVDYFNYLIKFTKVRIVHVVTKNTTEENLIKYKNFSKINNCQFTLKELVGYDDNGNYSRFKNKFPELFYLDSGDYNIYYFPNNTIGTNFLNPFKDNLIL